MVQTFDAWLLARDDEALAALLLRRPDVSMPSPPSMELLATRLMARSSILRAAERLTRVETELLDLISLQPGLTPARVAKVTGSLAHRAAATELLASALLLDDDAGALWVPPEVEHVLAERPFGLGRPGSQLRQLLLAVSPVAAPVPERADLALTDEERSLLEHLDAGGGVGALEGAVAALSRGSGVPHDLVRRGLLVPVDDDHVEMPREVGLALRGEPWGGAWGGLHPAPPSVRAGRVGVPAADRAGAAQAQEAVRLVEQLLEAWTEAPPTELRSGGLGVRDLRAAARLLGTDERTAVLLVEVAHAAGLVDRSARLDAVWLPTLDYDTWLTRTPAERWLRLADGWLGLRRLPGLVGTRDDRDKPLAPLAEEGVRSWAPELRGVVLSVLASVPSGQAPEPGWVDEVLRWRAPRRTVLHTPTLPGWFTDEAGLLGLLGRGAMTTAARRLLEGDRAGAVAAVAKVMPEPVDQIVLQPDHTAVVPGPMVPELARVLAIMTEVESSGAATVVRFTEPGLRKALDLGWSAADVHGWLARTSQTPVPQTLTYLVDDIARRHGRLRVGTAQTYLRCDDEVVLAEVVAHRRTQDLALRRLAAGVVISPMPVEAILQGLRLAGFSPVAERADGTVSIAAAERPRSTLRPRRQGAEAQWGADHAAKVVAALRESQRRAPAASSPTVAHRVTEALLDAARHKREVLLGFVDHAGRLTQRIVVPVEVSAGLLRAHDLRTDMTRTFPLSRINEVSSS